MEENLFQCADCYTWIRQLTLFEEGENNDGQLNKETEKDG
jgi:hypothetical protein